MFKPKLFYENVKNRGVLSAETQAKIFYIDFDKYTSCFNCFCARFLLKSLAKNSQDVNILYYRNKILHSL